MFSGFTKRDRVLSFSYRVLLFKSFILGFLFFKLELIIWEFLGSFILSVLSFFFDCVDIKR